METLLLAALIYARQVPPCPKPFVKAMEHNIYVPAEKAPRKPCRYTLHGGDVFYKGKP